MYHQKFTNKFNWPQEIVAAILKDRYTAEGEAPSDYSATTIVAPIQQTILKKKFPEKMKVFDVADQFWAFMGSIAHTVLEEAWHAQMGSKVEERLYATITNLVISGKIDCYGDRQIRDYKTTKSYKIMRGDFSDWEKQLNIYAYLCTKNGYPVDSLHVYAIIFDWKEQDVYQKGYPEAPIVKIPIPLWTLEQQQRYLDERIGLLLRAENKTPEQLAAAFPCSDKEKWSDIKDYAVMKDGGKRASAVFDNLEEAIAKRQELVAKAGEAIYDVVTRRSPPKRCMSHCPAATICCQWAKERTLNGEVESEKPLF